MNDPKPDLEQVGAVVAELTLDEKASLTAGVDMWATHGIERVGIPSWRMTDGPNGARGRYWGPAGTPAVAMPTGSALGATWDPALIREVGAELGREARARSARILLGPTVNPQRAPLAGRTFECFSEDPLLSGVLGVAYVEGVQSEGVAATVKHLAGNEAEWQRTSVSSEIDERTLREVYLLPFERCVRAGAMAVMTAYNRLNGDHCPNLKWLLQDILRREWGFDGIVITDWWGLFETTAAAESGLDLEMPGPSRRFGQALADAVRSGALSEDAVDAMVTRLLSVFARLDAWNDVDAGEWRRDGTAYSELARATSAASMVLIKNDRELLPLDLAPGTRVAVLGPNANAAFMMGGGSSQVRPQRREPLLAALRRNWGAHIEIVYEPGVPSTGQPTPLEPWELTNSRGEPGLLVEYYGNSDFAGDPIAIHHGDDFRMQYLGPAGPGIPYPEFWARASATFTASTPGRHEFVLRSNALARLLVDGRAVDDLGGEDGSDWFGSVRELRWELDLDEDEPVDLAVEFVHPRLDTYSRTSLACQRPTRADARERAVRAARDSDYVVVIVGTSDLVESEGYDRTDLELPDGQNELIEQVLVANPRTVVVVNSGGPVAMPWLTAAPAVVQAWFGGQSMGDALADVLDGDDAPGGRMPFTIPLKIEDTPTFGNFPGESGSLRYGEGLLVGHRWYDTRQLEVAVPFGAGRSYTTFEWSDIRLSSTTVDSDEGVTVELTIENTGSRPGSEVVQIYVTPPAATPLFRPARELKGFTKVHLEPRERRSVVVELDWRAFAYWTPEDRATSFHDEVRATPFASTVPNRVPAPGWTVINGDYLIAVSRSIQDVIAELPLRITGNIEGRR